jgi:hypothetical protein
LSDVLSATLGISTGCRAGILAACGLALLAATFAYAAPSQAPSSTVSASLAVPVVRRLTRIEYSNSIRDLFGVDFPFIAELPSDAQAAGFDNIGDAMSLSPVLLESYLKVARKVSDLVIGTGSASQVTESFPATGSQYEWHEGLPIGTRGGVLAKYYFPRAGEYELRAFLDSYFPGFGSGPLAPREGVRFFRTRVAISTGPHAFIATFPDNYAEREGPAPNLNGQAGKAAPGLGGPIDNQASAILPTIQFWLDGKNVKSFDIHGPTIGEAAFEAGPGPPILLRVEITGPFNPSPVVDTEARRRLVVCSPKWRSQENACAAKILTPVARRAYRRDVNSADMALILAAFSRKRKTASFDDSVGMGLRRILVSPDFLFRLELDPPGVSSGQTYRISDTELATRLSYFLWSSLPDDELLEEARRGQLKDPGKLQHQLRRMLSDQRADALVDNFGVQWLGLRDFASVHPDVVSYAEFDLGLASDFEQETRLFLRSVLRENRSALDLVSSDYTFLNQRLAEHYGVTGVYGPAFRKVKLDGNDHRGGVLSQGSILLVTSHAATTSPILRGKWVLTNLLNSPPPRPPPGVPPLNTKQPSEGRKLTTRELIERHRSSPVCAACHAKMDPYGIALENYDVLGRWRTEENGSPIDSSATLPHGNTFSGPVGLKGLLLSRSEEFVTATVSRLMTYALGRELEKSDVVSVREIVEKTKPTGYRFADLVAGVVNSVPFQTRQARSVDPTRQVAKTQE